MRLGSECQVFVVCQVRGIAGVLQTARTLSTRHHASLDPGQDRDRDTHQISRCPRHSGCLRRTVVARFEGA